MRDTAQVLFRVEGQQLRHTKPSDRESVVGELLQMGAQHLGPVWLAEGLGDQQGGARIVESIDDVLDDATPVRPRRSAPARDDGELAASTVRTSHHLTDQLGRLILLQPLNQCHDVTLPVRPAIRVSARSISCGTMGQSATSSRRNRRAAIWARTAARHQIQGCSTPGMPWAP